MRYEVRSMLVGAAAMFARIASGTAIADPDLDRKVGDPANGRMRILTSLLRFAHWPASMASATVVAVIVTYMLLATSTAVADGQSAPAAIPPITAPGESNTSSALYTVRDGNKVDAKTLAGWKTWRALACERCHGAAQEGLVGPALVESLKRLTKDEFHTTIMNGRLERGMPSFSSSKMVTENWEGLYAYLKGRSDDQIQPGRLSLLE
jgi:mono/diheme cytochrome c family protein